MRLRTTTTNANKEKNWQKLEAMELENKIKCVLMDFEIKQITLQEAIKRILLLDVAGRSEQLKALQNNIKVMKMNMNEMDKETFGRIVSVAQWCNQFKKLKKGLG